MDFSAVVKEKLVQKQLKITDLARLTGLSYAYLIDLLRGRRRWNEDNMHKVCDVLGIKIEFIDNTSPPGEVVSK
ncbi:helix-turn-helix domain-containing protein [Desulfofundulus sp.]|uniref:helix-turn-helix domain-containing protein n=1 Tax=Desulfofundulus sp. TaxID=2282750 RepID=UPI003C73F396